MVSVVVVVVVVRMCVFLIVEFDTCALVVVVLG